MSKASRARFSGGHQRSWLWGRNAVRETLSAACWPVLELYLETNDPELILPPGLVPKIVSRNRLEELCRSSEHQGYLARLGEFPYASELVLNKLPYPELIVALDGIQDPFNFGTMIRSAAALGAGAIIVGKQGQAPVGSHVVRSSAGAVNRIPIIQVDSLAECLKIVVSSTHDRGFRTWNLVGLNGESAQDLREVSLKGPVCLVIGNEGSGITPLVLANCTHQAKIPQTDRVESLNAAAAMAIALYEVARQRS